MQMWPPYMYPPSMTPMFMQPPPPSAAPSSKKTLKKQLREMQANMEAWADFLKVQEEKKKEKEGKSKGIRINPWTIALCFAAVQPMLAFGTALYLLTNYKDLILAVIK